MNEDDFALLFLRAVTRAEEAFNVKTGSVSSFEIHSPLGAGRVFEIADVASKVFLSGEKFYRIIDLGIISEKHGNSVGFVRVSGHPPVPFFETYDPSDLGPFKILAPAPGCS